MRTEKQEYRAVDLNTFVGVMIDVVAANQANFTEIPAAVGHRRCAVAPVAVDAKHVHVPDVLLKIGGRVIKLNTVKIGEGLGHNRLIERP